MDQFDEWSREQVQLSAKIILSDQFPEIKYIGGLDVTFVEGEKTIGIGAIVVIDAETLQLVYSEKYIAECTIPYKSGFLGFREIMYSKYLIHQLRSTNPEFEPQVYLVDGCGYYHPRHCGYASQLGVELDIATIGVSKSFLQMGGLNINEFEVSSSYLTIRYLRDSSGITLGAALYSSKNNSKHPIYISVGNRICLESSIEIVRKCLVHRIPEPIRLADKLSRHEASIFLSI